MPEQGRPDSACPEGHEDGGSGKPSRQRQQCQHGASHRYGDGGPQRKEFEEPVALTRQASPEKVTREVKDRQQQGRVQQAFRRP